MGHPGYQSTQNCTGNTMFTVSGPLTAKLSQTINFEFFWLERYSWHRKHSLLVHIEMNDWFFCLMNTEMKTEK